MVTDCKAPDYEDTEKVGGGKSLFTTSHENSIKKEEREKIKPRKQVEDLIEVDPDEPEEIPETWDQQEIPDSIEDIQFMIYWLTRKHKINIGYRGLAVQLVFLALFTSVMFLQHLDYSRYYLVSAVGGVVGDGEWDQGGTGLYFEKTFTDVQEIGDFWNWVKSAETMQSLFENELNTYQQQNKILPSVIRISQRRVENDSDHCTDANRFVDDKFNLHFGGCYPDYSSKTEDDDPLVPIHNHDQCAASSASPFPCGCDAGNRSGFTNEPQNLGAYASQVPALVRKIPDWTGRFATYSRHAYYFDLDPSIPKANFTAKMSCYEANNWIDASTRQVEISWFTYNPAVSRFLHHRFSVEFNSEGVLYAKAVFTPFMWFGFIASVGNVLELLLFILVSYNLGELLASIFVQIVVEKNYIRWAMSVWTILDLVNLSFFMYVFVWKFTFMRIGHVDMVVPDDDRKLPSELQSTFMSLTESEKDEIYRGEVYGLLLCYVNHYSQTSLLISCNALLSWLRLFKFVSLSPRLNLLSETIKEASADLIALLIYIFLVTHAYALCGMTLFGPYIVEFSTYSLAFTLLLRWLLGDFDYSSFLDHDLWKFSIFTTILFWSYIFLCWLLLLNMVISIISDGFNNAKRRQDIAIGSAPVQAQMKYWALLAEDYLRVKICGLKSRYSHRVSGPMKSGFFDAYINDIPIRKITACLRNLVNNETYIVKNGVPDFDREWPSEHANKLEHECQYPSCSTAVIAKFMVTDGLCDDETAQYLVKALTWYLTSDRTKDSMYYSRVFYEEVYKEQIIQTSGQYRQNYVQSLDLSKTESSLQNSNSEHLQLQLRKILGVLNERDELNHSGLFRRFDQRPLQHST